MAREGEKAHSDLRHDDRPRRASAVRTDEAKYLGNRRGSSPDVLQTRQRPRKKCQERFAPQINTRALERMHVRDKMTLPEGAAAH